MANNNGQTTKPYNEKDWQKGYRSLNNEYDYWIDEIEGEIPPQLQGTLFRNGPGLFEIDGTEIRHPFDGDGMISAITFNEGSAHFRNRFVRTEAFVKEQQAGKMLYRGVFGTQKPGGWLNNIFDLRLKNIANTNVIYWGGKLLALWEAAEPYRLTPDTLETLGIDYLDGLLSPGDSFAAHPWIDPSSALDDGEPCLVNFSIKPGLSSKIIIYEFAPTGELLRHQSHIVPGFAFMHDFAITEHYCIFLQNPVSYNPLPFILGLQGAGQCLKLQLQQSTRIVIIPRDSQSQESVKVIETKAGFVFHHANAFEQGDKIYLDSICYPSLPELEPGANYKEPNFAALDPGQLWRFTLNLTEETATSEMIEPRCCEFPITHPDYVGRPYRYLFLGAAAQENENAPLQGILKLDLESGKRWLHCFAPEGYVGEPIFVPRPGSNEEDDGWILVLVFDSRHLRSDLVILDGKNFDAPPVARLHLKHHIPYGLHGNWTSEFEFSTL
ncbi:MAG: Apocarotenoid-15,15'-oxygenase [Symploca sp. SIO1A3]|nr:Apocarotenoid-15,15'-oxygenase [Symploca sp. SIO1A3]